MPNAVIYCEDKDWLLNSFILPWTRHAQLSWGASRAQLEQQHVLFMTGDRASYVGKMFGMLG